MSVKEIEDYVIAEFGADFFRPDDDKNPRLVGSAIWYADQSLISYKISEWFNSTNKLHTSEFTQRPRRIDRSKWPKSEEFLKMDIQKLDDCHLPRNVYLDVEWKKFKPFLNLVFKNDTSLIEKFEQYRRDFVATN